MRKVSVFTRNGCPLCSGIGVRFKTEWLSALTRNTCPASSGMGVRFDPDFALTMRPFRPDKRYLLYNGHKIELFNEGVTVKINANTIGKVFNSSPKTFLKQPEVLKFMYDYSKYRLRPGNSQELKNRRHYTCSRGYSHDGIYNETYYFYKDLAVRYATWLNLDFGVWLFDQIDEIILELGNHSGLHRWEKKLYY